jgi:alkylation response protein AidB-like acyl-CoA dehydrogenase
MPDVSTAPGAAELPLRALNPEDLEDLRATVRSLADDAGGPALTRALEHPGAADHDVATWHALAVEVGLAGLGLPEHAGGAGGLVELLAVAEDLGARLVPVPFLASTVLAGQVLARCGGAGEAALARVCAGEIATVALADDAGRPAAGGVADAVTHGDTAAVSGRLRFVPDGMSAGALVVAVRTPDGLDLALVDPAGPGVVRRGMRVLDFGRPQATIDLDAAPAALLTTGGTGGAALWPALDVALLALAADQLGGMQRSFDLTVDYVKTRRQFNRPIGSFQAVKHRLADALGLVEQARSAVERVTWAPPDGPALAEAAAIAQAWCSEAYVAVTAELVQLHGGIGFTWEHDAHLYLRRARADAALWGDATHHRGRLAHLQRW